MKKKFILIFLILVFYNISNVYADDESGNDVSYINLSGGTKHSVGASNDAEGSCQATSNSTITPLTNGSYSLTPKHEYYSYDRKPVYAVILVDNSTSMGDDGGAKRIATNTTVTSILDNLPSGSVVKVIKFNGDRDQEVSATMSPSTAKTCGWGSPLMASDSKTTTKTIGTFTCGIPHKGIGGRTNIQGALKTAYNKIRDRGKTDNADYNYRTLIPMVFLVTDGYPSKYYKTTDVTKALTDPGWSSKFTSEGARSAYYTAKTLINLKDSLIKLPINKPGQGMENAAYSRVVTIGMGFDTKDEYARFVLDPTTANYNALCVDVNTLYSTESKTLCKYMQAVDPSYPIYDVTARKVGSSIASGEFKFMGMDDDGKNMKFNLPNRTGVSNWTEWRVVFGRLSSSDNDDDNLQFSGSTNEWQKKGDRAKRFRITKNGNLVTTDGGTTNSKNVKINYSVSGYLITERGTTAGLTSSSGVDKLLLGSIGEVTRDIAKTVVDYTKFRTFHREEGKAIATYSYYQKQHSNSTSKTITVNNSALYYKLPDTFKNAGYMYYNSNNLLVNNGYCVAISANNISMNTLVAEDSTMVINKGSVKYPGSGFPMTSLITNNLKWFYERESSKGDGLFKIKFPFSYTLKRVINSDNYYTLGDTDHLDNVRLSDLYTTNSCTGANATISDLSATHIVDKLDDNVSTPTSSIFKSVDSNDKSKETVVSTSISGGGNLSASKEYKYNISLNKGCIAVNDFDYNGVKLTNSSVFYLDNPTDKCDDSSHPSREGTRPEGDTMVNMHFIPIDYNKKTVDLKVTNVNLSNYNGISINYTMNCPVNVGKHDRDLKNKFKYRVIDVKNPFPKAGSDSSKIPTNWRQWYSITSNRTRMSTTYDRPYIYRVNVDKSSLSDITGFKNNPPYTKWTTINDNGSSQMISGLSNYFTSNSSGSFCNLGEVSNDENNCDQYK